MSRFQISKTFTTKKLQLISLTFNYHIGGKEAGLLQRNCCHCFVKFIADLHYFFVDLFFILDKNLIMKSNCIIIMKSTDNGAMDIKNQQQQLYWFKAHKMCPIDKKKLSGKKRTV